MEEQQRLFLRQKDFEMVKFKSSVNFEQSVNDPLLNPSRKYRKGATASQQINSQRKTTASINPLMSSVRSSVKTKDKFEDVAQDRGRRETISLNQDGEPLLHENKIKVQTPWDKILESFIKSYNFSSSTSNDLKLENPFGSYGLKVEDQLKGMQPRQSKSFLKSKPEPTAETENRTTIEIKTYLKVMELMKRDLDQKWSTDDRVGGLQIAIQSCKLLHDNSNTKFQALKFAYVIEIVDKFGILVFERIKRLAFPHLNAVELREVSLKSLKDVNVPQAAQEICRNWLIKIASIRELMPRTIIETALFRLHFFMNNGVRASSVLERLTKSNRSFGEYINCIFYSTFLIRIAREAFPFNKDFILNILEDVFFYIKRGKTKFSRHDVDYDELFSIIEPFFISSFEALSQSLEKEKFSKFMRILPHNPHHVILKNIFSTFSSSFLTNHCVALIKMVQKLPERHKYEQYKQVLDLFRGQTFSQSGEFIIAVWSDLSKLKDIEILFDLLGPFSEIIFRNLPRYQKNKFYALILESFTALFDNFRGIGARKIEKFEKFLSEIIERTEDIKDVLTLEPFLQLISYFPTKSKQQISFNIIRAFTKRDSNKIRDPVVVHIMLGLMKNLSNYKVRSSSEEVEQLALNFIDRIDFGTDLEESLSFYGQMRASFGYLEKVTVCLIYRAAGLTFSARKRAKGRITNKLISFLQAAVAFCYITVPVLTTQSLKSRMYLYISEVALANNLISQATSLIKTCITQVSEMEQSSDLEIYQIFFRIISFMIVVPDDPEKEYLFLFNGLYQAFMISKFKSNYEHIVKAQFFTHCVVYLSCQVQHALPFHLQGVVSNDALFKSLDFKQALTEKIYEVFADLESEVSQMQKTKTNLQTDAYIFHNLPDCLMSLIDVFDQSSARVVALLDKIVILLSRSKDSLVKKQNGQKLTKITNIIEGVNAKLKETNLPQRII